MRSDIAVTTLGHAIPNPMNTDRRITFNAMYAPFSTTDGN